MSDFATYDTISINGTTFPRPVGFAPAKERIYAGEYETCTGARLVDYVGWRYADMTLTWDGLDAASVAKLAAMGATSTITFDVPSTTTGEPAAVTEDIIPISSVQALHPYKQGTTTYYRQVSVAIRFLAAH